MVKSINVTEIEWTNKLLRQVSGQSSWQSNVYKHQCHAWCPTSIQLATWAVSR